MANQKPRKGVCSVCGRTLARKDLLFGAIVRESIASQIRMDVPGWSLPTVLEPEPRLKEKLGHRQLSCLGSG